MEPERDEMYHPERILDETPNSEAVKAYTNEILQLEGDLLELESQIAGVSLGYIGLASSREFTSLERRFQRKMNQLSRLRSASLQGTLDPLDIESDPTFRQYTGANEFGSHLDRLDRIAARTGQRLSSRRDAANTRLSLVISLIAVALSTISISVMALV